MYMFMYCRKDFYSLQCTGLRVWPMRNVRRVVHRDTLDRLFFSAGRELSQKLV